VTQTARVFRFRPRYQVVPWLSAALGLAIAGVGFTPGLDASSRLFCFATGVFGPALAALYLTSSAWKLRVELDDAELRLHAGDELRVRLAWNEVAKLVHSPTHKTAFVDGGVPDKSFVLPGPGVPAPYRIENQDELYAELVARIPADRHEIRG
jgi:hypothetical protein